MSTQLTPTSQSTSLTALSGSPLDRNPAAVYIASLPSAQSKRTMISALNLIAKMLGTPEALAELATDGSDKRRRTSQDVTYLFCRWQDLRFQHTAAIRAQLAEHYSAATANKALSALRQVLEQAWLLDLMSQEDFARAAKMDRITGERLPAGRALSTGEIKALLATCGNDDTAAGARDAALIALMYSCGLRRAELVGLDLASYNAETGELRVLGKRNKQRISPLVGGAKAALEDWLAVRGSADGPLFVPVRKGGHLSRGQRITAEAVWHALRRRAEAAGIKECSPHDMRRTFAGDLLTAGADIATVQKLMGHASVATTARYDRRPEEAKRKAAELLHVPYMRRRMV